MIRYIKIIGICILLSIVCSSYEDLDFGLYIGAQDPYIEYQLYDDWCYHATVTTFKGNEQCLWASEYKNWWLTKNQKIDPNPGDCCDWRGIFCNGVNYEETIPFWNYIANDNRGHWYNITSVFNYNLSPSFHCTLPCMGLLDLRSCGGTYHAIYVYRVLIRYNGSYSSYIVNYGDPGTGEIVSEITNCDGHNLFSTIYVMSY